MASRSKSNIDVEAYLRSLSVDSLVALLLDAAQWHEPLRQRLDAEAAAATAQTGQLTSSELKQLKEVLEDLIVPYGSFVPYRAAGRWARTASSSADVLGELLDTEQWEAAIELAEHAIALYHRAIESVDDSDGYFGTLVDDVLIAHHGACVDAQAAASPSKRSSLSDPIRLAGVVFEWETHNDYGLLDNIFERYVDVLGPAGLTAIGTLIAAPLKSAKPGHGDFAIRHLAEKHAEATGTLDDVIAVLATDLSSSYQYLQIAERLVKAKRHDEALRWALDGIVAHPTSGDYRLHDFAIAAYLGAGRAADANALAARLHTAAPTVATFTRLRDVALRTGTWDGSRQRAFATLRKSLTKIPAKGIGHLPRWQQPTGFGPLVEVYLLDDQPGAAWDSAQEGGCTDAIWLRLATARQSTHPAQAIPIFVRHLEATIDAKNNDAYSDAVNQLRHLRTVFDSARDPAGFEALVSSIRTRHKPKRNLMALLDRTRLS